MSDIKNSGCCEKTKHRNMDEKKDLTIRVNKISGQIEGIKKMIDSDRYCDDILIQLVAIDKAIKSLANRMLKTHMQTCVTEEIKKGNKEIIDEVINLFGRFN